jgi:hypothetical protein
MKIHINHKSFFFALTAVFLCVVPACKKFVTIDPPETKVDGSTVFGSDDLATSAVIGLYTTIQGSNNSFLNGATTIYPSLSSDDIAVTTTNATYNAFLNNAIPSNNSTLGTLWSKGYNYIFHANIILEGLAKSSAITEQVKSQLRGETKFLRALTYFYLVNLFGDVPLVTSSDYKVNQELQRAPVSEVYKLITSDLLEAQSILPTNYVTSPAFPTARARANKWAATALLARVYLYMKDYAKAETEANAIIASGMYGLVTNIKNVFLTTSNEAILQFTPVSTYNTSEGNLFIPATATARPIFILTNDLLNAFEANDQRKLNWTKTVTISNIDYTYPYKYKVQNGGSPYSEYNMVLRFAEMYLIRAESRANLNNLDGAISDINVIKGRAGVTLLPANLTQSQVLSAIEKERRVEFFAEFGHRWLDLKRTDRANTVLPALKGANWQTTDTLYPIPLTQTTKPPFLTQNNGY